MWTVAHMAKDLWQNMGARVNAATRSSRSSIIDEDVHQASFWSVDNTQLLTMHVPNI